MSATTSKKLKIGIMGGSFNPPHLGHINSLKTVHKKFLLDWIYVVPAFKPPLSRSIKEASPLQRTEMLKAAFKNRPFVKVDEREIRRKKTSYSYITVEEIAEQWEKAELFFILGLDQFQIWDNWKNSSKILTKSHLIVTSRSGGEFPASKKNLPKALQKDVSFFSEGLVTLKTKKNIYFCQLKDKNISSTLVREKLKKGESARSLIQEKYKKESSVCSLIPSSVSAYINEKGLYSGAASSAPIQATQQESGGEERWGMNISAPIQATQQESPSLFPSIHKSASVYKTNPELKTTKEMISFCCKALKSKKAFNIKLYDFSSAPNKPFYFALIASSLHPPHSKTLVRYLQKQIQESFSLSPFGKEGEKEGQWIALDYNALGVHIFYDYNREKYGFDEIWSDFLSKA